MIAEKRTSFMDNIRKENRMKTINRRRLEQQPFTSNTDQVNSELTRFQHLFDNPNKKEIIELATLLETSDETLEVPLVQIKEMILSNDV
jgi:hypothetical protein